MVACGQVRNGVTEAQKGWRGRCRGAQTSVEASEKGAARVLEGKRSLSALPEASPVGSSNRHGRSPLGRPRLVPPDCGRNKKKSERISQRARMRLAAASIPSPPTAPATLCTLCATAEMIFDVVVHLRTSYIRQLSAPHRLKHSSFHNPFLPFARTRRYIHPSHASFIAFAA